MKGNKIKTYVSDDILTIVAFLSSIEDWTCSEYCIDDISCLDELVDEFKKKHKKRIFGE